VTLLFLLPVPTTVVKHATEDNTSDMGNGLSTLRLRLSSSFTLLLLLIAIISHIPLVDANDPFARAICAANITGEYQKPNGLRWDSSIIFSIVDVLSPVLTLKGCEKLCGSGTGWYPDIGPRLIEWFLPIFLLISNMQFPLIGMERFFLVLHLLGDPIDSTWSLLDKIHTWNRCYALARKQLSNEEDVWALAIIYAARKEVEDVSDHELEQTNFNNMTLVRTTAGDLLRQRRNEIFRTVFAVAMYIFQVISAFVPSVGASSSPSGGKIGTAMLLSWLVSVVMLSNTVGDLGSPASIEKTISAFMSSNEQPVNIVTVSVWSGALYSYHPSKGLGNSGWRLATISVLPVVIAFGTSFTVLEAGPTYFSCRSLFVVGASAYWGLSAILTYAFSRNAAQARIATGKKLWYLVLVKDFLVAAPVLGLIVASSCGYWNTCYCWGGGPAHGDGTKVPLNPTNIFNFNNGKFYPAIVGAGLGLQLIVFLVMLGFGWHGFRTMGLRLPLPKWIVSWWWERRIVEGPDHQAAGPKAQPQWENRELNCMGIMNENKGGTEINWEEV
jgi:hypothetical protein